MKKILFVCHGNICRSPMAEFVMKDMAAKAGVDRVAELLGACRRRVNDEPLPYPGFSGHILHHKLRHRTAADVSMADE